jgi:hypothetical protein
VSPGGDYSCGGSLPAVSGAVILPLSAGSAHFSDLFVSCMPGGEMTVLFEDTTASSLVKSNTISLLFRTCLVGEYYSSGECRKCEVGFYSKKPNTNLSVTQCETCPVSAAACNGSSIVLRAGYWAVSEESPRIMQCPMGTSACPGGIQRRGGGGGGDEGGDASTMSLAGGASSLNTDIDTGDVATASSLAGCREGYLGQLCAVCAQDYFYHPSSNTCASCDGGSHGIAIALLVLFLFFPTLLLVKLVVDRHKGKTEFSQVWGDEGFMTACVYKLLLWWKQRQESESFVFCLYIRPRKFLIFVL